MKFFFSLTEFAQYLFFSFVTEFDSVLLFFYNCIWNCFSSHVYNFDKYFFFSSVFFFCNWVWKSLCFFICEKLLFLKKSYIFCVTYVIYVNSNKKHVIWLVICFIWYSLYWMKHIISTKLSHVLFKWYISFIYLFINFIPAEYRLEKSI